MNSPILIGGSPGSGTSLVAKMLRHAGLFTGADSGPADARKYHESQCFMQHNIRFLTHTIDFPHAPKSVEQFARHNLHMEQRIAELAGLIDRNQLFSEYLGGQNNAPPENRSWGWKDPRNSATALIWKQAFPELSVIAVSRRWRWRDRWKPGGSESGKWFRQQSTAKLRQMYERPFGISANKLLVVDFQRFTTDADYFADVLTWCKLDRDPANRFEEFLSAVGLER